MKRFAPFITCFYLCSLFMPLSLRANVLPVAETSVTGAAADDYYKSSRAQLKVLSNDKVGQTLVASEALSSTAALSGLVSGAAGLAGVAYYERTGKDPVYAAFDAVASAADALFVPAYQAFKANFVSPESYPASAAQYVGVEGSVGAKLGDIIDFVNSSADGLYDDLKNIIKGAMGAPSIDKTFLSQNDVFKVPGSTDGKLYKITTPAAVLADPVTLATWNTWVANKLHWTWGSTEYAFTGVALWTYIFSEQKVYSQSVDLTTNPITINPIDGSVNYPELKADLLPWLATDPAELNDIVNAVPADQKITSSDSAPSQVPSSTPAPITNNQIQNFFAQNTTNVYNKTLETITNNETSTTTEITNEVAGAAAEAAKAQEEEAEKQTEETFNPITDSAFEEPYNPGEFDIPARFTQFLNNVKSSGLFSFSNDFFNSLPGGGSPIFEVEGGRYGHHTIDLSETMSGGLAVLKTVLLLCFGFLSIRAVIMKR